MRFSRIITVCLAICGALTCGLTFVHAQGQSINSDTLQQPNSNFGSGFNSNTGGSISSPGTNMFSTPLPAPSFANGSTSGSSGSGGTTGTSGLGGTGDASAASALMQQNQLNPFGGGATGTGQLGSGGLNSGRNSSFGRFGAFGNLFNNQAFQNGFGQNDTPRLPTKLTVKFDHPKIPTNLVSADITRRIRKIGRFPNVTVSVEDRVATVSGIVESEDDLRLIDRFVSLEVGVSSVVNQLELQEPSPADQ
ncbi:BON domain protein [Bremerella volcania]|uniref:BON domain protein n=1 Tax=Bremerella volcania TaxID=2527984 RepID=A0A518CAD0_9BACT|nr:BON domain-containing protein [Bremerella volcania]QDU76186.1 BON domain protein [Bremerella volcania]